jgi:hypothetical protein
VAVTLNPPFKVFISMKYIITESQYNLVVESQNRIQLFQELIDTNLSYIRNECEKESENYMRDVSYFTCDEVNQVEEIKVMNVDWSAVKHSNKPEEHKYMTVKLMVYYSSIYKGDFDVEDLIYDLKQMMHNSTGIPILLDYESTNTNTSFEW